MIATGTYQTTPKKTEEGPHVQSFDVSERQERIEERERLKERVKQKNRNFTKDVFAMLRARRRDVKNNQDAVFATQGLACVSKARTKYEAKYARLARGRIERFDPATHPDVDVHEDFSEDPWKR